MTVFRGTKIITYIARIVNFCVYNAAHNHYEYLLTFRRNNLTDKLNDTTMVNNIIYYYTKGME